MLIRSQSKHSFLASLLAFCVFVSIGFASEEKEGVFQSPEAFIDEAFEGARPKPQIVWLTKDLKEEVSSILGHPYHSFRIRYWKVGKRSAWILDEIGKVKPITAGIIVQNGQIARLKVLVYRESHGWEVKYPFFTDQFKTLELDSKKRLSKKVDGISGATLSVNALKSLSRLALFLDGNLNASN